MGMAYKHHESDKFRAETFRFLGYVLSTPLGLSILYLLLNGKIDYYWGFTISILLLVLGLQFIFKSYDIMLIKEYSND